MPDEARSGPRLLVWWENLDTVHQVLIGGPVLAVILAVLNAGPMSQPVLRSIGYGLIEGAFFTALLIVVTRYERSRRSASEGEEAEDDETGRTIVP
ncbi:MAG TPA: hypothetical protein VIA06_18840 [Candidatus Dormibacteraeota bacterium]|jgi:hypothetical protein|nr:hypothetical protein [Candidatus Dormibacteraeota bacterium]